MTGILHEVFLPSEDSIKKKPQIKILCLKYGQTYPGERVGTSLKEEHDYSGKLLHMMQELCLHMWPARRDWLANGHSVTDLMVKKFK